MNFFETLFENIDLENTMDTDDANNFDMSEEDFEQAIEVMEANKFLAQSRLDSLNVEKACLEAEIANINGFFLGEGISDIKDKALELWEKFKEWVQGILAKVKVFFAKFAMSRKQMTVLDLQLEKAKDSEKFPKGLSHLGMKKGLSLANLKAIRNGLAKVSINANEITSDKLETLKTTVGTVTALAESFNDNVKKTIDENSLTAEPLVKLHTFIISVIGTFIKSLETNLKTAQNMQRKYDRLGRGTDPKLDSDAVSEVRGLITAGNRIYATAIKLFFSQVRAAKNIIAYVGKDANLDSSTKKDMNKIKGRVKF